MNAETLRALWADKVRFIEEPFIAAARELADAVAIQHLTGNDIVLYDAQFQCAIKTRNTMLNVAAKYLLDDASPEVRQTERYLQYQDGLISAVECISYF